jgi:hypothetical protein
MTDNPGWASPSSSPDDGAPDQAAPHGPEPADTAPGTGQPGTPPNWSKQQPPRGDWTAPGWGPAPGGPGAHRPPPPAGWHTAPGWGGPQQPQPPQWGGQQWGNQAWGYAPAAKPGVIPLRPLGVGEILDGAVSTMRAHWRTVLGVALVVALVTETINTLITWWLFSGMDDKLNDFPDNPSFGDVMNVFGGLFAGAGFAQLITLLGTLIVTAMLTMVVSRSVLGRPVSTGEAWNDAKPLLPRLLGLTLLLPLIGLAIMIIAALPGVLALVAGSDALGATLLVLGLLAGVGVSVWLLVRFSLAHPALMLEKQGVITSMNRSTKLVRGSWWRVFGVLLLTSIITMIISGIVETPFTVISLIVDGHAAGGFFTGESTGDPGLSSLAITGIGTALGMTVTFPISAGVTTLLYIDQRIRREALDIELARAAGVPGYGTGSQQPPATPHPHTDVPAPGN